MAVLVILCAIDVVLFFLSLLQSFLCGKEKILELGSVLLGG